MSDIHILTGSFKDNGSGSLRIAYHIPVPATYQNGTLASYPADVTRTSAVSGLAAQELTDIQDGTLYEYVESMSINIGGNQAAHTAKIRARWHDIQTIASDLVIDQYKFYGTTLAQS